MFNKAKKDYSEHFKTLKRNIEKWELFGNSRETDNELTHLEHVFG